MWDDEPSPWDIGDDAPADGAAAEGGDGTAPAAASDDKKGAAAAAADGPFDWRAANLAKCDPPHYTRHWVRPLFLNYRYIYDYRYDSKVDDFQCFSVGWE